MLNISQPAQAQTPRFSVTPIKVLGFTPDPHFYGVMGINDKGQCVYGYMVGEPAEMHAWIYLPQPNYGLAAGFHDLNTLSTLTEPTPNIAHDLNNDCHRRASYWVDPCVLTNLGNIMPPGQAGHQSVAEAINNAFLRQVVGWNETGDTALLWEQDGSGGWTVLDLSTPAAIGPMAGRFEINQAHDINDLGWIIAYGLKLQEPDAGKYFALLLRPTGGGSSMMGNANGDGAVDQADLELVMGSSTGACTDGLVCWGDLNADDYVDAADMSLVLQGMSGLPAELIDMWLIAGGEVAMSSGQIDAPELSAVLGQETAGAMIGSLFTALTE